MSLDGLYDYKVSVNLFTIISPLNYVSKTNGKFRSISTLIVVDYIFNILIHFICKKKKVEFIYKKEFLF